MEFTYDVVIGLCIVSAILGFLCGYLPESIRYQKLKNKPLTYYELLQLPNGTKVWLREYYSEAEGDMHKEQGEIYTRKDGTKIIDVGDGDIEFTQANVWLIK